MPMIEISDESLTKLWDALEPRIEKLPPMSQEREAATELLTFPSKAVEFAIEGYLRSLEPPSLS
jgi:hypothetical protein